MSGFWRTWLTVWCGAIALFGLIIAAAGLAATSYPLEVLFSLLNPSETLMPTPHLRFSLAVLGAVTIGWGLTLYAVLQAAIQLDKPHNRTTWILVTAAVISWYVIDSSLSVATGFGGNAIANTGFLLTFLIPILSSGVLSNPNPDHLQ